MPSLMQLQVRQCLAQPPLGHLQQELLELLLEVPEFWGQSAQFSFLLLYSFQRQSQQLVSGHMKVVVIGRISERSATMINGIGDWGKVAQSRFALGWTPAIFRFESRQRGFWSQPLFH